MRLLLSSRGFETESITKAFLNLLPQKDGIVISIITTASEEFKEKNKYAQALKSKLKLLGFESEYVDVEFQKSSELENSDVIILNGGNPYYLLYHLRKSGADKLLKEKLKNNGVVYGISAGFIVLQDNIEVIDLITPKMNKLKLKDKRGLGIIKEVIVPHFDRFVKEGLINLGTISSYENQIQNKVIRLEESEGIIYHEGTMRILR